MKFGMPMLDNKNYPHELLYTDLHKLKFINVGNSKLMLKRKKGLHTLKKVNV